MPKSEMLHEFYKTCQDIELGEAFDLISETKTADEAIYIIYRSSTDRFIIIAGLRK